MSRQFIPISDVQILQGEVHRLIVTDERGKELVTLRVAVYTNEKGVNVDVNFPQEGRLQVAEFCNGSMAVLTKGINVQGFMKTHSVEIHTEV